ncbi:hypothetical protein ACFQ0M_05595 [Kitasatospora aburaviensis]
MHADLGDAEELLPEFGDPGLDGRAGAVNTSWPPRPRATGGSALRSVLPLGVSGIRSSTATASGTM